ncbi:hypothetical protein L5515_014380 [Caenorhabditis briggsae]|uniref:Uncharacterized protein n=1 Tax=Caenorhabditis briggsae TaxID=6238 RepID=A0AAE9E8Z3_CAEBR|nr:hypothetical protein L5515_014380 [Caenorhabditis briggsae]
MFYDSKAFGLTDSNSHRRGQIAKNAWCPGPTSKTSRTVSQIPGFTGFEFRGQERRNSKVFGHHSTSCLVVSSRRAGIVIFVYPETTGLRCKVCAIGNNDVLSVIPRLSHAPDIALKLTLSQNIMVETSWKVPYSVAPMKLLMKNPQN